VVPWTAATVTVASTINVSVRADRGLTRDSGVQLIQRRARTGEPRFSVVSSHRPRSPKFLGNKRFLRQPSLDVDIRNLRSCRRDSGDGLRLRPRDRLALPGRARPGVIGHERVIDPQLGDRLRRVRT
jgi:hypothetical protein